MCNRHQLYKTNLSSIQGAIINSARVMARSKRESVLAKRLVEVNELKESRKTTTVDFMRHVICCEFCQELPDAPPVENARKYIGELA